MHFYKLYKIRIRVGFFENVAYIANTISVAIVKKKNIKFINI